MIGTYFGTVHHIFSFLPPFRVRRCYTLSRQCFLSSVVGVTGSARLFTWQGTGRHWQRNAPCLQVRRPPTAPLLKQSWRGLWTLHTQMAPKACVNSMSITGNLRLARCVCKAIVEYFVGRTNEQIIWGLSGANKKVVSEQMDNMTRKNRGKHACMLTLNLFVD